RPKQIVRAAEKSNALIFFVGIAEWEGQPLGGLPYGRSYSLDQLNGSDFIQQLTNISGGKHYEAYSIRPTRGLLPPEKEGRYPINQVFERLSGELRSQYAISFIPTKGENANAKKIEVKLVRPKQIKENFGSIAVRYRKKISQN
ncbi:MAG TPA: hypothetical protein VGQ55_14805, partial [Pyrinomonadaceae bacterium]|nr:hypothetical protein [Pyrinomonadaceae bacterium]